MNTRFGIVVVHWRGMPDTVACLRSLAAIDDRADIVVVANGSDDIEPAAVGAACPYATLVRSNVNRGYGGGCNLGARQLLENGPGPDYLLFLNNDVTLAPQTLRRLSAEFECRPNAAIVGAVVTYADDPGLIWFAGGYLNGILGYTRHFRFRSRTMPNATRHVDFVNGAAIAIRAGVFERLGGFDEAYFHYFEDTDLSVRARSRGYECVVIQEPLVQHRVSASAGAAGSNRLNADQAYYFTRNRLRFVTRDFRGWRRLTAVVAQFLVLLPYESAKALAARNPAEAHGRLLGVIDGLRGKTGPRR